MHAGISPGLKTLKDIDHIDRFKEIPIFEPVADLVWSDPTKDPNNERNYSPNRTRGCGVVFGPDLLR